MGVLAATSAGTVVYETHCSTTDRGTVTLIQNAGQGNTAGSGGLRLVDKGGQQYRVEVDVECDMDDVNGERTVEAGDWTGVITTSEPVN
ncbi:MAG: hypothetical protein ACKOBG_12670, partial [Actinomycetota bacterium]